MTTPAWNAVLTIAGVDQSDHLEGFGATIILSEDRSSATFVLLGLTPLVGQLVQIVNGEDVFRGRVSAVVTAYRRNATLQCTVSCNDLATIFDSRLVHGNFIGYKTGEIIRALMMTFFPHEGIEYYAKVSDGVNAPHFTFAYKTMTQALTMLCDYSGYVWNVDRYGCLVYAPANPSSSVTITDSDVAEVKVVESTVGYRNKQYVLGGGSETKPITVHYPRATAYVMPFPLAQAPRIFVNKTEVPSSSIGVRGLQAERPWLWAYNETSITVNARSTTTEDVSLLDTVTFIFIGLAPTMVLVEDNAGQEDHGVYESYEPLTFLNSADATEQSAIALLAKNVMPEKVTVKTFSPVLMPNMGATIDISGLSVVGVHRVSSTTITDLGNIASYSSELCVGANDPWRLFFSRLADGCRPEVSTEDFPELEKPVDTISLTDVWTAPYVGPMVAYVDYEDAVHHPAHVGFVEFIPSGMQAVADFVGATEFLTLVKGGTAGLVDYPIGEDLGITDAMVIQWPIPVEEGFIVLDGIMTEAANTVELNDYVTFADTIGHDPVQPLLDDMSPTDFVDASLSIPTSEELGLVEAFVFHAVNNIVQVEPVTFAEIMVAGPGRCENDEMGPSDALLEGVGLVQGEVTSETDAVVATELHYRFFNEALAFTEVPVAGMTFQLTDAMEPVDANITDVRFFVTESEQVDDSMSYIVRYHIGFGDAPVFAEVIFSASAKNIEDVTSTAELTVTQAGFEQTNALDVAEAQTLLIRHYINLADSTSYGDALSYGLGLLTTETSSISDHNEQDIRHYPADDLVPTDGLTQQVGQHLSDATTYGESMSRASSVSPEELLTVTATESVELLMAWSEEMPVSAAENVTSTNYVGLLDGVAVAVVNMLDLGRPFAEPMNPTDALTTGVGLVLVDGQESGDYLLQTSVGHVDIDDSPEMNEAMTRSGQSFITDATLAVDAMAHATIANNGMAETSPVLDGLTAGVRQSLVDYQVVGDVTTVTVGKPWGESEVVTDGLTSEVGPRFAEVSIVTDSISPRSRNYNVLAEIVSFVEAPLRNAGQMLTDLTTVTDVYTSSVGKPMAELLPMSDVLAVVSTNYLALSDAVGFTDAMVIPYKTSSVESLSASDVLVFAIMPRPTDTMSMLDALTTKTRNYPTMADGLAWVESVTAVSTLARPTATATDDISFGEAFKVSVYTSGVLSKTLYSVQLIETPALSEAQGVIAYLSAGTTRPIITMRDGVTFQDTLRT